MSTLLRRACLHALNGLYRLLPAWYRDRDGGDLLLTCRTRVQEETSELRALRTAMREVIGLVPLIMRLRFESTRQPKPERNRITLMESIRLDLTFALRTFLRRPAFTLLVVLVFGLGVGATTAMYSAVDAVLLRPLPAPDPERIVSIYPTYPAWRSDARLSAFWQHGTFSWPGYQAFKQNQRSYVAVAAYTGGRETITSGGTPEQISIGFATPELFTMFGARPAAGRLFTAEDAADVVLLTFGFWQTRFGGDQNVIGRRIEMGTRSVLIIGVLPADFEIARVRRGPEVMQAVLWRPIAPDPADSNWGPNNEFLTVVGRLRPGVTVPAASAEAARLIATITAVSETRHSGRVVARVQDQSETLRLPLLVLIGSSLLLLFAACASVATMLLGAGLDREAELRIRAALGAQRSRITRQLFTEGILLGLVGGALGVALSNGILQFLLRLAPAGMPGLANASIDTRVLLVALACSLLFALLFSTVPALVLSRVRLAVSHGTRVTRSAHNRLQLALVVAELALAALLLSGAGLLTRTMLHLNAVDPGFRPDGLITVRVAPAYARFRAVDGAPTSANITTYFDQLSQSLRTIPGVDAVAVAGMLPFSTDGGSNAIEPEGHRASAGQPFQAERRPVSGNYFEVMGMQVVAGRGFADADNQPNAERVVVVNEQLARRFWPGESGVGKRLGFWDQQWTIVGVVRDTREFDLRGEGSNKFYVPGKRLSGGDGSFVLRIASKDGAPAGLSSALANQIRQRIWSIDATLPVTQITTMRERMGESIVEQRYRTRLMLAFSGLALIIAIAGVYGTLARAVTRRQRELGIRSALGAVRSELSNLMLRQGFALGLAGLALGLTTGHFGARVLKSMLYQTRPSDPVTLAVISGLILGMSLFAAWQPARRASRVEPMEVLRSD